MFVEVDVIGWGLEGQHLFLRVHKFTIKMKKKISRLKTLKKMWELIFQRLSKISVALLLYIYLSNYK